MCQRDILRLAYTKGHKIRCGDKSRYLKKQIVYQWFCCERDPIYTYDYLNDILRNRSQYPLKMQYNCIMEISHEWRLPG